MNSNVGRKRKLSDLRDILDQTSDINEIRRILRDDDIIPDDGNVQGPLRIRKHILKFDKALNLNQQLRINYADDPKKFMDSEIKLNDEIENLTQELSADTSVYNEFVRLGALDSCLSLLAHENVDIVISTVRLLHAIFDIDSKEEEQYLAVVIDRITKADGFPILVETLSRFDENEEEDREAISLLLNTLEAIVEADNNIAELILQKTNLLAVLIDRIALSNSSHDENRFTTADLVAIFLLHGGSRGRESFAKTSLEKIFTVLRMFIERDPSGDGEKGLVENLYSAITCILLDAPLRSHFESAGGLQFCLDCIRSKNFLTFYALKALNLALQKNRNNCQKWIDLGGLKAIFAMLMAGKSKRHKKHKISVEEEEECLVSIIANLFMQTSDTQYQRLLGKFVEKEHEKIDRIIELHQQFKELDENSDSENASFALQLVDFVLGFVITAGDPQISKHALKQLQLNSIKFEEIETSLRHLHDEIGDVTDDNVDEDAELQRNIITGIISRLHD